MPLTLFDTMTRAPKVVTPLEDDHIRIYTCGPTVYAHAHIGNFRTFMFEDILRRWLDRRFTRVTHVMNLTDVEDKIIRNARSSGNTLDEETAPWIDGFFDDIDALGIRRAHHYPRATAYIDEMVEIIIRLRQEGLTYERDGSIYFSIHAFPSYGRLSGMQQEGLVAGASGRVDADEYSKDDARDFALWKVVDADDPYGWESKLGRGRPGWHIECSAMSMSLLGEQLDIHCGGVDNIFPHHENEIAQSEGSTHQTFSQVWCHGAFLQIDGEKMAKSLGNFQTVHDLIAETSADPASIRYLLSAVAHYRKTLSYSTDSLEMAKEAVDRWATFAKRVARSAHDGATSHEVIPLIEQAWAKFENAMDDDLNLPEGMGYVFQTVREVNRLLDEVTLTPDEHAALMHFIDDIDDIVGVLPLVERSGSAELTPKERQLLDARKRARAQKDWAAADTLRGDLTALGIVVEDTPSGQQWRKA